MSPINLLLAFSLDLAIGDPESFPHPVRVIGKAVSRLEGLLYAPARRPAFDAAAGTLLVAVIVLSVFFSVHYLVLFAYKHLGMVGGAAVSVYLAYTAISVKGLGAAALCVHRGLEDGDLPGARKSLSMVVGRDTDGLDGPEVVRGAVETVSENASDGVVAPLIYLALGGVPLALAYKAVNTMDSMIGYRSDRYRHFGWAAARLDDLANLVPARLTGLLVVAAARILSMFGYGCSWRGAWNMLLRDGSRHSSPNSGYPEAAAAGALGVRLGGANSYQGVSCIKPFIGEPLEPLAPGRIKEAVRLMYAASFLALVVSAVLAYALRGKIV